LLQGTIGRLPFIGRKMDEHLESARDYVRWRKGSAVFFGRFTAALRVLVPGLAGMSDVPYPSFAAYNVAGGLLWGAGFAVLGYVAGASYRRAARIAGRVGLLLALIVVGLVASSLLRNLADRSSRLRAVVERAAATPLVGWVRRRFPRQMRWARYRVDPRDPRGFLLTFTVVLGALSAWALGGLTQDVVGHDDTVLRDPGVETWVTGHRTAWLTSVMRVVTFKSLEHRRDGLKSAFIQIMPLTWDSFLLPVMDSQPWRTI